MFQISKLSNEFWEVDPINEFSCQIFTEYIGHPTATAEMKLADGWLATGDIGQVDNDCNIILLDRKKEMIKSLSNCPYLTVS